MYGNVLCIKLNFFLVCVLLVLENTKLQILKYYFIHMKLFFINMWCQLYLAAYVENVAKRNKKITD